MELNVDALNNQLSEIATQNNAASLEAARQQNAFQVAQNAKAMAFNADQARINREWQQFMSDTAHQREVKDLLAAGLNPILSANGGASTPSGSVATGVTSAGAMAQTDMSRNAVIGNIFTSMINADVARENAALQASTSIQNALTNAKAVTDAAGIAAAASRYATDHPNNPWGMLRITLDGALQGLGQTGIVETAKNAGDTVRDFVDESAKDIKENGLIDYGKRLIKSIYNRGKDLLRPVSKDYGKNPEGNDWI